MGVITVNPELDLLLVNARQFCPTLKGVSTPPLKGSTLDLKADNRRIIGQIHTFWRQKNPEAGTVFWSARCWANLIWQPIYLALASVYGRGQLPMLTSIQQFVCQGTVSGFHLRDTHMATGEESHLIEQAVPQLHAIYEALLQQSMEVFLLKPKTAQRLAVDSLLSGTLNVAMVAPQCKPSSVVAISERWLQALRWQSSSQLIASKQGTLNNVKLIHKRKSCCFSYRCDDRNACTNCPRKALEKSRRQPKQRKYAVN